MPILLLSAHFMDRFYRQEGFSKQTKQQVTDKTAQLKQEKKRLSQNIYTRLRRRVLHDSGSRKQHRQEH